ncbi:MAG: Zn-dependent hydrolase [Candidatus Rokubacteria bacterium]|nr:Zn-dependent hydrolase [Candidatus Rokubacteria bacterium]
MNAISFSRLEQRLRTLAGFGGLPGGGVTRQAFSARHEEARGWLLAEMASAGLETWVDAAANVFGATGIRHFSPDRPVVLTGSHIDTVPEGGPLDGALGVLAGLECLQTIVEAGLTHRLPLAVAAWTDEEGRFGSLFGSRAFSGRLDTARIADMASSDGERLVDAMARAGFDAFRAGEAKVDPAAISAYVEMHIEQGPRLEEAGVPIGVVEAIVGIRRVRARFVGQADHAGTTPMERRRDGFLAAAEYAVKAREIVGKHGGAHAVANVGVVHVHPGVANIVPARCELVHEMRAPDADVLERLAKSFAALARRVAKRRAVEVEVQPMSATAPAVCAPPVQAAITDACAALGLPAMRLHSAAGHDAQNLASITDAGMIFIPSVGGRSHRIDETSAPDAIERGANVLLHTLLRLAA